MKLICGITVAEEKGKVGKEGKVCVCKFLLEIDHLFNISFWLICNIIFTDNVSLYGMWTWGMIVPNGQF